MSWLTADAEQTGRWKHTAAGTSSPVAPVYGDGDERRTLKLAFVASCEEEPSHHTSSHTQMKLHARGHMTHVRHHLSLSDETCDESWNLSGSLFFIFFVLPSPHLFSPGLLSSPCRYVLVVPSLLSVFFFSQIISLCFSISVLACLTWRHPDVPDGSPFWCWWKGVQEWPKPLALPGPSLGFYVHFLHSWNQTVCSRLWLSGFNEPSHDYYDAQQRSAHESVMKVTVRCSLHLISY